MLGSHFSQILFRFTLQNFFYPQTVIGDVYFTAHKKMIKILKLMNKKTNKILMNKISEEWC